MGLSADSYAEIETWGEELYRKFNSPLKPDFNMYTFNLDSGDQGFNHEAIHSEGDTEISLRMNQLNQTTIDAGLIMLSFGRNSLSWGPSRFANLALSSTSKPYEYMTFDIPVGENMYFTWMTGFLRQTNELQEEGGGKILSGHRFEYQMTDWFMFSFYETVVYTDRFELAYVNPFSLYHISEVTQGDLDNKMGGFDFLFRFASSNLYLSLFVDDWGMGQTGNLLLSDYSDFYNIIRFTTFWEKFKYTAVYIGLDSWLTDEEKEIDETENGLAGGYYNFKEQYKALLAHRLEFRTTEQLNISFNESIIFGNKYINITELNPVFVFHNLFSPEYSNAMISMEADYTPTKGLNIYLQYALDEFQIPGYEDEDTRPAADGVMTGFRYIEPVKSGYLTFSGEFALTDPYLYNRWHPLTRFTNRRRIWSNIEPDGYEYINKPIGYQYGPDAIIFYAKIGYSVSALYSADIDARYSIKGELNDSLDDPQSYKTGEDANSLSAGSGITENELVVGFHSTVFPLSRFSLSADLYWIDIANYNHSSGKSVNDLELAVSGKIRF